jgi:N-formylglutamate amidohydrolase
MLVASVTVPPLVLHVPHSSTVVPPEVRPQLTVSDEELGLELLRMTDWYTDELFALPPDEAATVRYPVSRLVVDPERFEDPDREPMEMVGMGAAYTRTADGARLRDQAVAARERESLLARYYRPHHEALEAATAAALEAHGRCLIVDCHSFPSELLPYETKAAAGREFLVPRPAVCLGSDRFHTPRWLLRRAWLHVHEIIDRWPHAVPHRVAFDEPFAGTIVPSRFLRADGRVMSLMIELRRDLYMDEETGERLPDFAGCALAVQDKLRDLAPLAWSAVRSA